MDVVLHIFLYKISNSRIFPFLSNHAKYLILISSYLVTKHDNSSLLVFSNFYNLLKYIIIFYKVKLYNNLSISRWFIQNYMHALNLNPSWSDFPRLAVVVGREATVLGILLRSTRDVGRRKDDYLIWRLLSMNTPKHILLISSPAYCLAQE